jgi:hypothetical protein
MPLVKVAKVAYTESGAEVTVEGAWGPWTKVAGDAVSPLPDYQAAAGRAEEDLSGLEEVVGY